MKFKNTNIELRSRSFVTRKNEFKDILKHQWHCSQCQSLYKPTVNIKIGEITMTKNQIITFLKTNKDKFAQQYHIANITLFGSYARGEHHENSDIDLIYSLQKGTKLSFDKYLEFEEELKKAFDVDVDLVNEKKFNPLIKIQAQKDFIHV